MTHRRAARAAALALGACVALLPRLASAANVAIKDFEFAPASVTISAGDSVDWRYAIGDGTAPHTVTADDGSFDSGNIAPGGDFSHEFTEAGTVRYYCSVHGGAGGQGMSGVVVVKEEESHDHHSATPTATATTSSTGTTSTTTKDKTETRTSKATATPSATSTARAARRTARPTTRASASSTAVAAAPIADRDSGSRSGLAVPAALALTLAAYGRLRARPR